jgi:hypothetical protein
MPDLHMMMVDGKVTVVDMGPMLARHRREIIDHRAAAVGQVVEALAVESIGHRGTARRVGPARAGARRRGASDASVGALTAGGRAVSAGFASPGRGPAGRASAGLTGPSIRNNVRKVEPWQAPATASGSGEPRRRND